MKKGVVRAIVEITFIVFLFYANLLMGGFERSGQGATRGLSWAIQDMCTTQNLRIALIAAFAGYVVFEFLRGKVLD